MKRLCTLLAPIIILTLMLIYTDCSNDDVDDNSTDEDIYDDDSNDDDNLDDDSDDDSTNESCKSKNYAIQVVEYKIAENGGFGEEYLPNNVLGAPSGRGDFAPQSSPAEVLSLGDGGYIILKLGRKVIDEEGADFVVFENPFFIGGNPNRIFIEAAVVEVSQDGENWVRFPFNYEPVGEDPWSNPNNFSGLAGVNPVYGNCDSDENFVDPLDPKVSGGDFFDLADIGLDWVAYIKIIDAGNAETYPESQIYDADGDAIDDAGNHGFASAPFAGFDLDAVGIIHGGEELQPD
ncbi:MAG: hypothetical protein QXH91_03525 [Candidatus Bathyarchaeia archaeon]